ncbi:hypothetical protein GCM10010885_01680 [Alicyclobacillus cellulosilyticus]|uniref:DUF2627 domain-containing protein n=1 Tax=Alicyclobacillus cellulosilyticus TaxID=1003997 RepID=A0A917K0H2_9BACL|nr:DUF2627 family protein [Alicyclobacillus cellulosilyticus]GGI95670.1 hypothetical protein GCM10010885_01680 [Alicyclobacillus cellulosilyticus]
MRKELHRVGKALAAWGVLIGVFLLAGEGINLVRLGVENWLAYGRFRDAAQAILGLVLAGACTAFLGGFIYHRDQKRGRIRRRGKAASNRRETASNRRLHP